MTDPEIRDDDLAAAFLTPRAPERPELAAAIMGRVRRADHRRRLVIATAGAVGIGIAVSAVAVAGLFDPASLRTMVILASSEAAAAAVGLTLIVLAAGRYAWDDA